MSMQLLSTIRNSLRSFKTFSGRFSISKTRRPTRVTFRQLPAPKPDLMFCNGRCDEATTFDHLCPACVNEYFDWKQEKA